ncbi:MAG: ABC-2 transporter permease [Nitrososphaerota archaeon]|jgi:ABC-type transport system involved in multi-copper enzyme maturation permease subunit|nr:ABC-2 transporter permease [Nitrososphaerota archaeon]
MTNLKNFIQLNFMTAKPYFTVKTLLIISMVILFQAIMTGSVFSEIGVGALLGTLFMGYPFASAEKNNLDTLYATLSIKRKAVVAGRYLFALLLNGGTILFAFVLASAGLYFVGAVGFSYSSIGVSQIEPWIMLAAMFIGIQAIQLPIYFKVGYAKAKFLSIVPFVALIAGYFMFLNVSDVSAGPIGFFDKLAVTGLVVPAIVVVLVGIMFISYGLSAGFYKKREF